jgi:hypothetical protein
MHEHQPDRQLTNGRYISDEDVSTIQDMWDHRITIAKLAVAFEISETMVRFIISQPRRQPPAP